jgi:hypothetical protein
LLGCEVLEDADLVGRGWKLNCGHD